MAGAQEHRFPILLHGHNHHIHSRDHCCTKRMQDWLHFQILDCV